MTEISTGHSAFFNHELDIHLMKKICEKGLRPHFSFGTPDCYIELAKQCMDSDPQKRPVANDICNKLGEWIKSIEDYGDSEIKKQFLCSDDVFIKLDECFKNLKNLDDLNEIMNQFFDDDTINKYKFDEDLDEIKEQILDSVKYSKETSYDHKYKSKYYQKNTNSLLIPMLS
ncbi:serine/threonine protein kinase [Gigaspora margarita]|uniref:Serine/threonine protein kinase n=1 Tax=Gigaspora margarita TaxID=4874 RepID=A0A8H3XCN2_GIGMA|nr:serine/threonine protein kinase [Gigaspora margarita]